VCVCVCVCVCVGQFAEKNEIQDHMVTAFAMGVTQLVVCITKMDHPDVYFAQSSYDDIKEWVSGRIKRIGHSLAKTHFVPISVAGPLVHFCIRTLLWNANTMAVSLSIQEITCSTGRL
jgi:translation elongation factor EF-1alpha